MSFNGARTRRLKVQIIFSIFLAAGLVCPLAAQDIHFSQFHITQLYFNPASTGMNGADFRLVNLYRNQWRQLGVPYNTLFLAAEKRSRFVGRDLGLGAMIIHDESSSLYLTSDKFYISLSHAFYYRRHRIVAGLQPGYVRKHYNSDRLTFAAQFDPSNSEFNSGLPSNENFLEQDLQYFDLNAGILWQARIQELKPSAGFSVHHVNRPVESFYGNNDSLRLPVKFAVNAAIEIPVRDRISLTPGFVYTHTQSASEFMLGVLGTYFPENQNIPVKRIFAISNYRIHPFRTLDALILGGGLQFNQFQMLFSYDMNVSSLRRATHLRGGFEISIVYLRLSRSTSDTPEPCFML